VRPLNNKKEYLVFIENSSTCAHKGGDRSPSVWIISQLNLLGCCIGSSTCDGTQSPGASFVMASWHFITIHLIASDKLQMCYDELHNMQ